MQLPEPARRSRPASLFDGIFTAVAAGGGVILGDRIANIWLGVVLGFVFALAVAVAIGVWRVRSGKL